MSQSSKLPQEASPPQPARPDRGRISYAFIVLAIAHLVLGVAYLSWRSSDGMSEDARVLSWVFLLAEGFTLVGAIGFSLSNLRHRRMAADDRFSPLERSLAQLPYIDVLIVRQGESIASTCQTAQLAIQLEYPWHRLFVRIVDCDRDVVLEQASTTVPCDYHASAVERSRALQDILQQDLLLGDYLLVLEPGQFPDPQLLKQSLPFFFDTLETAPIANRTGYVQPVLEQLNRQRAEHPLQQLIPVGVLGGECAPLLGMGALFRRKALATLPQIDWSYPVRLGTELHIRGWTSHLCRSSSVSGASIPFRSRLMSLLALQHALRLLPWWRIPIVQSQRFQYVWLALWSIGGFAAIVYFFVPVWFLWTGVAPVPAFDRVFFAWFLPYAITGRLAWLASTSPLNWPSVWRAERQTGAQFFQSIQSTLLAFVGKLPVSKAPSRVSFGPQALAILLTLSGIVVGVIRLFSSPVKPPTIAIAFGLAWAIYNLALLSVVPPDLLIPKPKVTDS